MAKMDYTQLIFIDSYAISCLQKKTVKCLTSSFLFIKACGLYEIPVVMELISCKFGYYVHKICKLDEVWT